jgi:ABC-type nickel/cobalt efflux system permease component RcnA
MLTILTGLITGFSHVLSGPDHLAAVTPFSLNLRKKAWLIGFMWGLGHTIGAILIGVVFILFKELIPMDFITQNSEKIVGILLILIGLWALWRVLRNTPPASHSHPHIHSNPLAFIHIHRHVHEADHQHLHDHPRSYRQSAFFALFIGIVHGLAGFSHLVAVLPSLALPGKAESIIYLSSFGAGTILTMIGFTGLLGLLAGRLEQSRQKNLLRGASLAGGILAIAVGVFWLVRPF